MNPLFKKLNYKDQGVLHVFDAPDSFRANLNEMVELAEVVEDEWDSEKAEFVLAFATKKYQLDKIAGFVHDRSEGDVVVWVAYPKKSSKKFECEFSRDEGWEPFGSRGFEPVRMVAIDEDWSALRFRRVQFIKTMTRGFAMSKEGKAKIQLHKK